MTDDARALYLLLIGTAGSGKSTWARWHFGPQAIVSSDRLRATIAGDGPYNPHVNEYVFAAVHAIVAGRLTAGLPVVVDATNARPAHRTALLDHAYRLGVPPFAVIFDTPVETCVERNAARPTRRRVPAQWVRDTHAAIAADFPPATMWMPHGFSGALWVRPDGANTVGGILTMSRYRGEPWLAGALNPDGTYRQSAWARDALATPSKES